MSFNSNAVLIIAICLLLAPLIGEQAEEVQTAQPPEQLHIQKVYEQGIETQRFDALMAEFGRNKELPEGYELQALLALSHYPELRDIKIRFIQDDVNIPISSRPHWATLWRSAAKRTYLVVIDTEREGGGNSLIVKNQPFNAQVGIIGHELAHTVYYLDRSFLGILGDAVCQLSDCRVDFERNTDKRLIDYGLGWQRFEHSSFIREGFERLGFVSEGESVYFGPAEIMDLMESHPAYQQTL